MGRPKGSGKFGESSVHVRVPESMKDNIEDLVELYQRLPELLAAWENSYKAGSVRDEAARKCAQDLRDITGL